MGCAQGFTFSVGFFIILLAHLVSIMTHIALGNDLILSKVSYSANNVVYSYLFLFSQHCVSKYIHVNDHIYFIYL